MTDRIGTFLRERAPDPLCRVCRHSDRRWFFASGFLRFHTLDVIDAET